MSRWKEVLKIGLRRGVLVPFLAVAMAASVGVYELAKPTSAAAVAEVAPAPLDDNSVSALLSLDHAMETVAAQSYPRSRQHYGDLENQGQQPGRQ